MRNTNKKGFTIVELVIVVAVIAILAAVLIPTFSGIIAKAKLSADQKALHDMNTFVAMEGATNFNDAVAALKKNGINAENIVPLSADKVFTWVDADKKFAIADANTGKSIVESIKTEIAADVTTATDLEVAVHFGSSAITLNADVTVPSSITVPAGVEVTIDLNGKTVTADVSDSVNNKHHYAFDVKGSLTLKNGTINARGIQTYAGAELVIEDGVTINAVDDNGGACVYVRKDSVVTINGGSFNSLACKSELNGGSVIINDGGEIIINNGTFVSEVNGPYVINHWSGKTTINGGTFKAVRGVVSTVGGTLNITGGTFTKTNLNNNAGYELYVDGGNATVTGGTFTNEIFYGYSK